MFRDIMPMVGSSGVEHYVNNHYGTGWFVVFRGATCGIAASALWVSEGAIALEYAETKDRGKFTGIWLSLPELGQLVRSSIQLSLNVKGGQRGKVGYIRYLVPLVIYRDGRKVPDPTKNKAVMKEVHEWWALLIDKRFFFLFL
ncbi:hypothetical protein K458DRAFT_392961 [Lentithecium fluviatile CBS 122367]|uniref:Uncharacterized protein n=1 Tax=Lentithecium fluviatile CBS 122367 TaxID=1168545 RepID=A0A6G1IR14_9PLEO|nr:hypothetical protein K458DRAFT_392961 [Lentithecium fluviatile CBS 122367]